MKNNLFRSLAEFDVVELTLLIGLAVSRLAGYVGVGGDKVFLPLLVNFPSAVALVIEVI